jgi:hypothetical protein
LLCFALLCFALLCCALFQNFLRTSYLKAKGTCEAWLCGTGYFAGRYVEQRNAAVRNRQRARVWMSRTGSVFHEDESCTHIGRAEKKYEGCLHCVH